MLGRRDQIPEAFWYKRNVRNRKLRLRLPEIPVFLFSFGEKMVFPSEEGFDQELLFACIQAGGARGAVRTSLTALA